MIFNLSQYNDLSLLLLRLIIAIVFISSGWGHASKPAVQGKDLGLPTMVAFSLGVWEILGALSVLLGIYAQIGALMLILTMFGAIYKRIFVWNMKFFQNSTDGWHYDVIFLIANLVVLTTGGGHYIII